MRCAKITDHEKLKVGKEGNSQRRRIMVGGLEKMRLKMRFCTLFQGVCDGDILENKVLVGWELEHLKV